MKKMFELRKESGFSLVELMIVVAIIAILAAIAIPAFMRFALKSKTSEATGNLAAIRTCQESHRAENDVYLACPENPGLPPTASPRTWLAVPGGFADIGFEPDGQVRYSYIVTYAPAKANEFVAQATGDLDGADGVHWFRITKGAIGYPTPLEGGPGDF